MGLAAFLAVRFSSRLSVALAPLRVVLPSGPWHGLRFEGELLLGISIIAFFNLIVTVPCIWGGLFTNWRMRWLLPAWLSYCVVLTAAEFGIVWAVFRPPPRGNDFLMFQVVNAAQVVTVFGVLRLYRAMGYRLVRVAPAPALASQGSDKPLS
jgi:hypothetical protein